ncbi:class I SAM-dependent methyltransferase [Ruminococcaceae bacterium OttesenSCG-928-L11]|nr:class I SAM-dependent methyltransferase [Ruminococcaceae bacterium OttesenSCG-928-L11]
MSDVVNTEEIRRFFDGLAATWESPQSEAGVRDRIVELIELPEAAVIADIGCGKGVMFPHLLRTNPAQLLAVELSGEMLAQAQKEHADPRIAYCPGDLLSLELPPVDAAVIFNAYPHFLDKPALARRLARLVKPGGKAVIAHSRSKELINGRHRSTLAFTLSVPLQEPAREAAEFAPYFEADTLIDTDEMYFIRLIRTAD